MFFMTLLKIVFTILVCVPIFCLMLYVLTKLIDDVLRQTPKKRRKKKKVQNRSSYR